MRWKLRAPHFTGNAGTHTINTAGRDISFDVDGDGYFEMNPEDAKTAHITVFAAADLPGRPPD